MADNKRLAFSIIQFLHEQQQSGGLSSGALESLEGESAGDSAGCTANARGSSIFLRKLSPKPTLYT